MTEPLGSAPIALPLECEEFLTWLSASKGRANNTLTAYRRDLRLYASWLARQHRTPLDVRPDDLVRFVEEVRSSDRAPASVARICVAVRSFHRFLAEEDIRADDPFVGIEVPKVPRGLPKALSEDEITRLIDQVVGEGPIARRDRAILEVLYGTGVRISELAGLSLSDVDLDAASLRVFGKGAKERIIPVGRLAREALAAWLEPGGRDLLQSERADRDSATAVFLNNRGGRMTRQGIWGVVRKYGSRAGLGARLTPHVLRHSCATHMLDHGADVRAVQELLGHASITTTQLYTLVSTERLRAVYDAAHPRAKVRADRRIR
ncbi:MAG: site-specific tyrosine recombinase XerD [Acidimicrobiales bacterium]|nr:site-specific tyrosine recombinase XerD [Acidimicrobiales bacterium]